jgi:hypothetical protein
MQLAAAGDCTPPSDCVICGLFSPDGTGVPCYWDISISWDSVCIPDIGGTESFSIASGSVAFRMYYPGPSNSYSDTCELTGIYFCAIPVLFCTASPTCGGSCIDTFEIRIQILAEVYWAKNPDGTCLLSAIFYFRTTTASLLPFIFSSAYYYSANYNCTTAFPITFSPTVCDGITCPSALNPSITLSPSSTTFDEGCPDFIYPYGSCPGSLPPPPPPPPFPIFLSCPGSGICDDTQPSVCIKTQNAISGLVLCDGVTGATGPITADLSGLCSTRSAIYSGFNGNVSANIYFTSIGGVPFGPGPGNELLFISDRTTGGIIWIGCLDALTGNYKVIPDAVGLCTLANIGVATIEVDAGSCPSCVLSSCNLGLYLSAYNLALAAGTINGTKVSDTTGCLGLSFFSQSSLTWTAQNLTMNQVFGLCQWTEATVPVSTTLTTIYYAADGVTVLCTTSSSYNPSWAIRLNTVDDGGGPGDGTLGYWQLEGSISGLASGMPNFPNGVNGQIWENLCANPGPVGIYSLGSVVS